MPTIFAVDGIVVVAFFATVAASLGIVAVFACFADQLTRNDTGRYGDDGITQHHDYGGEKLPHGSDGRNVAITSGGKGDNGPVDGFGDIGETGIGAPLNEVHDGPEDGDEDADEEEEDGDFGEAGPEGGSDVLPLGEEVAQLEDTEDTHEPQRTNNEKSLGTTKEKGNIGREDGEQIDDAKEAAGVLPGVVNGVEPKYILDGENTGKDPLQDE